MTPEEQFNQEVWWLLQEIKKDYLATPKGEKVSFGLRYLPKNANYVAYGIPTPNTQTKLLQKFNKEFKILDNLEAAHSPFDFEEFFKPPTGYLFIVRQPQFDKVYSKYEEKNALKEVQNLPQDKEVVDENWTEKEVLETVLLELSESVSRHINKNTCNVGITISSLDKNVGSPKETAFRKRVISSLKSEGIIQDYKLQTSKETIIFFNYQENKNPEGKLIKDDVLIAECRVNPQKVIDYTTEVFEPKKMYCEKLAELYTKLIDIVEAYFTKPVVRDKKLNSFYIALTGSIKEMMYEDLVPHLRLTNWQPFTNLFSAEEEMKKKGVNLKETIQIMNAFLGEVYKLTTIFDVKPKKENETIKDLDSYLASIRTQKKKQKKEPTPSKIELTIKKERQVKQHSPRKDNLLFTKNLKPDITIGKLSAYTDGTIRYVNNIIKMRNQLKDLCRLFMRNPNRLLTVDDIKEEIVKADRRSMTSFSTIAKYVSELHNSLKIHFGKDVIFNQKEEGWYFKP